MQPHSIGDFSTEISNSVLARLTCTIPIMSINLNNKLYFSANQILSKWLLNFNMDKMFLLLNAFDYLYTESKNKTNLHSNCGISYYEFHFPLL